MGSALVYVIVVGLVAAAVYLVAAFVFGRGEELAPMPPGATPTRLPARDLTGGDIRDLRFQQALRGYKCSEVDWALERLAAEVDALRARVEAMEGAAAESAPEPAPDPAPASRANGHAARDVDDPAPTDPTVRAEQARSASSGASPGPGRGMSGVDGPRR
jgi:DivIVA domain-containing protein